MLLYWVRSDVTKVIRVIAVPTGETISICRSRIAGAYIALKTRGTLFESVGRHQSKRPAMPCSHPIWFGAAIAYLVLYLALIAAVLAAAAKSWGHRSW